MAENWSFSPDRKASPWNWHSGIEAVGNPPSPWRLPIVLLLAITLSPLAIVAWILLSGDRRETYWQSWCVKSGLVIAVMASLPLLFVGIAAELGLWPDRNPNPVGFGLLFVFGVALGSVLALIGVLWTHLRARDG